MSIPDEEQKKIRVLASYVPKLLLKRFQLAAQPVVPPLIELTTAAVLFADISGDSSLLYPLTRITISLATRCRGEHPSSPP